MVGRKRGGRSWASEKGELYAGLVSRQVYADVQARRTKAKGGLEIPFGVENSLHFSPFFLLLNLGRNETTEEFVSGDDSAYAPGGSVW